MIRATIFLLLTALASSFDIKDLKFILQGDTLTSLFLEGMLKGLQEDPNNPSPCVVSYTSVSDSYSTLISTFGTIDVDMPFNLVDNFNDFVNQFVASYDLCDYSTLVEKYLSGGKTALLNFLIYFTANFESIKTAYSSLEANLENSETELAGENAGQIIRYSTGISL